MRDPPKNNKNHINITATKKISVNGIGIAI
jgi:hypothetical protein